ncbi:MAG: VOC family protein [Kordiimonadaceae bacterium]|nr:VOC family protein [Kordiimonadaceae bacterium]MBL4790844.1 VOC family protein [Kordiimonadaceae bacterium]
MTKEEGVITGIGGIFVKCTDRAKLLRWYQEVLKFPFDGYGASFSFPKTGDEKHGGYQVWAPFDSDTDHFSPSTKDFMINFRVRGLEALLKRLKAEGVEQMGEIDVYDYGKFAWILDPEGTKIELWEQTSPPPAN